MFGELTILPCARKHGVEDEDIKCALDNAMAIRRRNFDPSCHFAAAGADSHGRLIELLLAQQDNGTFIVYHAMKLTSKMASELDLNRSTR